MATITDVARLAGVSHQTVSRVLNDENAVRPVTRAKVDAAIRELNYRPSAAARALVTRKTRMIGLVTTGTPLYGPSSTMTAFNQAAREAGYQVAIASLASTDRDAVVDAIDTLLRQDVDALVIIVADYSTFDVLGDLDIPVPLIAAESSGRAGFLSVSIDQYKGARLATRHLIDLGHRQILHIAGAAGSVDAGERERGWRSELLAAGLEVHEPLVGTWLPDSGYEVGRALAASGALGAVASRDASGVRGAVGHAASAIFCANDQMAIGLLHALADAGVEVPGRVSIVGFDDIPESAHFSPPLTTVRQDFADLGERMMAALLEAMSGGPSVQASSVQSPSRVMHSSPTLLVRRSTAELSTAARD